MFLNESVLPSAWQSGKKFVTSQKIMSMAEYPLLERLDGIEARFEEVSTLITDPAVIADMKRYVRLSKEYKDLEKLTSLTRRYRALTQYRRGKTDSLRRDRR